MTAFVVGAALLAAIVLPGLLRCRIEAVLRQDEFVLRWKLLGIPIGSTKGKKNKHSQSGEGLEKKEKQGSLTGRRFVRRLLPRLIGQLRVDRVEICFVSAGPDPWETVMAYAGSGLMLQALELAAEGRVKKLKLEHRLDLWAGRGRLEGIVSAWVPARQLLSLSIAAWRKDAGR